MLSSSLRRPSMFLVCRNAAFAVVSQSEGVRGNVACAEREIGKDQQLAS